MKNIFTLLLAFLALPACVSESPLTGKPCPCATGQICCEASNRCQAPGEICAANSPMDGSSADTAPPVHLGGPDLGTSPRDGGAVDTHTADGATPSRWQPIPETPSLVVSTTRRGAVFMDDRLTIFTDPHWRNETWSYRFAQNDWVRVSQGPMAAYFYSYAGKVWTGTRLLYWGGSFAPGATLDLIGGLYDPVTDTWSPISLDSALAMGVEGSAYTGQEVFMYGTISGGDVTPQSGVFYNPSTDRWRAAPTLGAPTAAIAAVVGLGSRIVVWGGEYYDPTEVFLIFAGDGAVYDVATDSWTPMAPQNAPGPRAAMIAFAAGGQAFLWGGTDGTANSLGEQTIFRDGAMYDPNRDLWTPISTANSPVRAAGGLWVEEQGLAYVWAGQDSPGMTLWTYNPANDTWATFDIADLPALKAVSFHWTGSKLLAIGFLGSVDATGGAVGSLRLTGYLFNP